MSMSMLVMIVVVDKWEVGQREKKSSLWSAVNVYPQSKRSLRPKITLIFWKLL